MICKYQSPYRNCTNKITAFKNHSCKLIPNFALILLIYGKPKIGCNTLWAMHVATTSLLPSQNGFKTISKQAFICCGQRLVLPIIGSVFIGGRWIYVVYMFCWGFIYGRWRLSFSTFGGIFLEGGWSNVAGMFEWASVITGWRCHRTLHFLSGWQWLWVRWRALV